MITARGDVVTITATITFSKKDTQNENWNTVKKRLIAGTEAQFHSQLALVEERGRHEAEVKERTRGTAG